MAFFDEKSFSRDLLGELCKVEQLGDVIPLPSDAEAFGCSLWGLTRYALSLDNLDSEDYSARPMLTPFLARTSLQHCPPDTRTLTLKLFTDSDCARTTDLRYQAHLRGREKKRVINSFFSLCAKGYFLQSGGQPSWTTCLSRDRGLYLISYTVYRRP